MTTKATQPTKAKCRSCAAEIYWARMISSGKAIPLDVEPRKDGNLWCSQRQTSTGIELVAVPAQALDDPRLDSFNRDRRRWVSHFATCPNATKHRGAR